MTTRICLIAGISIFSLTVLTLVARSQAEADAASVESLAAQFEEMGPVAK